MQPIPPVLQPSRRTRGEPLGKILRGYKRDKLREFYIESILDGSPIKDAEAQLARAIFSKKYGREIDDPDPRSGFQKGYKRTAEQRAAASNRESNPMLRIQPEFRNQEIFTRTNVNASKSISKNHPHYLHHMEGHSGRGDQKLFMKAYEDYYGVGGVKPRKAPVRKPKN